MTEAIVSMRGNVIAFHTYPLEEPAVWVGLNSSVTPSGNVTDAYPTTWANTMGACCGGWGYHPMPTETIGYGASQIYEDSCWGHPAQSGDPNLCPAPRTAADAVELFNRVGLHWQDAFKHAKALGVQTVSARARHRRINCTLLVLREISHPRVCAHRSIGAPS